MTSKDELFPEIGKVAEKADEEVTAEQTAAPQYDEERPVQEIVSLCMNCGENVSNSVWDLVWRSDVRIY